MTELIYVHDPMCSWCWAFRPVWKELQSQLPDSLPVLRWVGGLAPDSDQAMTEQTRQMISNTWKTIEQQVPGTMFNHDFWHKAEPRRSTYPACRAVIAAREQSAEEAMLEALQEAYYLRAMNPSDTTTSLQLARELGLDVDAFEKSLLSPQTHQALLNEIESARRIGGNSFPSLFVRQGKTVHDIPVDYRDAKRMFAPILEVCERSN